MKLFDINRNLFSFNYNGKRTEGIKNGILDNCISVKCEIKEYPEFDAFEWKTTYKNISDHDSKVLSDIIDCDIRCAYEYDEKPVSKGFYPDDNATKVYKMKGSTWAKDEFLPGFEFLVDKKRSYAPVGGRSSQGTAPFFDINQREHGIILAVGWTGQWNVKMQRENNDVVIKSGLENTHFILHPNEEVTTSSTLVMEYDNGQNNGHNKFRRLIKEHFSVIGENKRLKEAPLCCMFWGALPSDVMIERINKIGENKLGYDNVWIDAGWYGSSKEECVNEHEGDWYEYTGQWNVNKKYHPDELTEVSRCVHNNNMKLTFWIEPERATNKSPIVKEHPDWVLKSEKNENDNLVNLGNDDARSYVINLVSELIEKLNIDCYRQDFNIDPYDFWIENEEDNRKGITEIKYINGLYKFWDTLLEKYPNLVIDNCSSGGKRIDIETLKRSVPLWRSDYQCVWNIWPESAQIQGNSISWWLPFSGTGAGKLMGDDYRTRSCFGTALVHFFWGYADCEMNEKDFEWVRKINAEYKKIREIMAYDYYPLIMPSDSESDWSAAQFDRPEKNDGVIIIFRRKDSPFDTARLNLGGIKDNTVYSFKNIDTDEEFDLSSEELKSGFNVCVSNKRESKILYYKFC